MRATRAPLVSVFNPNHRHPTRLPDAFGTLKNCDLVMVSATRWLLCGIIAALAIMFIIAPMPFGDITMVIPSTNASVCGNVPSYLKLVKEVVLVHGPNSPPCPGVINVKQLDITLGAANRFRGANHVQTRFILSLDNDMMPYRWSIRQLRSELLKFSHGHIGGVNRRCDRTGYYPDNADAHGYRQVVLTKMSMHYAQEMRDIVPPYYKLYSGQLKAKNGNGEDIIYKIGRAHV